MVSGFVFSIKIIIECKIECNRLRNHTGREKHTNKRGRPFLLILFFFFYPLTFVGYSMVSGFVFSIKIIIECKTDIKGTSRSFLALK